MAFMFIQPTIIVPILLVVLILLAFIGIIALIVKRMRKVRARMKANIEKMKKLSSSYKVKVK